MGDKVPIAHSRIAQFELGNETPPKDVSDALDAILEADGDLRDLWGHTKRELPPDWHRRFVQYEAKATTMVKYMPQTVPGLLQTEAYARALFRSARPGFGDRLEQMVSNRLARQVVLAGPKPPLLWVVLDEAVLYRRFGGPETMRGQLASLLRTRAAADRVVIQVLPFAVESAPLVGGSVTVMSFAHQADIAYLENSHLGNLVEDPNAVEGYALALDHARTMALSPDASADLIRSVMESEYRDVQIPAQSPDGQLAQEQLQRQSVRRLHRNSPRYPRRRPGPRQ